MNRANSGTLRVLVLVTTLLLWEALVRIFPVPQFILPAPSRILTALYRGAASGVYLHNFWFTLTETLLGFVLGSIVAIGIGTLIALNRRIEYYLYPYIVMFQSMPKVALAPLIIVWFGIGLTSKVVSAVLVAFFPLLVNTVAGLRSVDEDRINLMRSLAASQRQIFWMLRLPSALPFIMAGLEVAMIFSLIGAIVAEFIGAEAGLGMLIQSMNFNMDVAGEFSVLFVLAVMGLVLNTILTSIRKRVLFWDPSQKDAQGALSVKRGTHL
jgi:NitT/TauT family transport system permease protein